MPMSVHTRFHNGLIASAAALAIGLAWFDVAPYFGYAKAVTTLLILLFFTRFAQGFSRLEFGLAIAALLFCLGGDIALLSDERFLLGLCSFLLGHLLFIVLFARLAGGSISWVGLILVFAATSGYFIYISAGLAGMALPVAAYVTVISLMAVWGISLHKRFGQIGSRLIMFGGLLFLVSDGVLAYNRFVSPAEIFHPIVLLTYWLSLTLIVNGLVKLKQR